MKKRNIALVVFTILLALIYWQYKEARMEIRNDQILYSCISSDSLRIDCRESAFRLHADKPEVKDSVLFLKVYEVSLYSFFAWNFATPVRVKIDKDVKGVNLNGRYYQLGEIAACKWVRQ